MLREIKGLRSDYSTRPDNIPAKFVKLVAEHLVSPLTHIMNSCLDRNEFPLLWKTAPISPIPKVDQPRTNDDYRTISILPVLSKLYEKFSLRQIIDFLTENVILQSNISSYRKCHSTTTTMSAIRDDVLKAMKRGEITLAVMADFSKAFNTVAFENVLSKLHLMGFSGTAQQWIASYLTGRKQFLQVDDRSSAQIITTYGVPQGSILGPVLFNLYVNDLSSPLPSEVACHQYSDDTTMYIHFRPSDLEVGMSVIQDALNKLSDWSLECNLALNPKKTKVMMLSSAQMSRAHGLKTLSLNLTVSNFHLLGTQVNQHLNWKEEINSKISCCYAALAVIRKLKHLTPFHVRKRVV